MKHIPLSVDALRRKILEARRKLGMIALALMGAFTSNTTASAPSGSSIFGTIWGWVTQLVGGIVSDMGGVFASTFTGFGNSLVLMFQSFGFSMQGYGVWAPVMFVVGIGAAILVGYLLLDFIDGEKDITGMEDDL